MKSITCVAVATSFLAGLAQAATTTTATSTFHAGFTWPTQRAWTSQNDQSIPCGSADGVGDRTHFPLTNGAVALKINDESFKVNMAISYNKNPTVNGDFVNIVDYSHFPVLDPGNECYSTPDPASNVLSGQNATLQLSYAALEGTRYRTFYACADIVFVPLSSFTETVSCFNYSSETGETSSASGVAPTPAQTSSSSSDSSSGSSSSSKHHLSGGAIAGIVVGVVVAFMLAALFIIFKVVRRVKLNARIRDNHLQLKQLKRDSEIRASLKAQAGPA